MRGLQRLRPVSSSSGGAVDTCGSPEGGVAAATAVVSVPVRVVSVPVRVVVVLGQRTVPLPPKSQAPPQSPVLPRCPTCPVRFSKHSPVLFLLFSVVAQAKTVVARRRPRILVARHQPAAAMGVLLSHLPETPDTVRGGERFLGFLDTLSANIVF